jgi:uncharacterized protein DUF1552
MKLMNRRSFSRRALLQTGLGGVFLAPFLRQRTLEAQTALPKRLVLVFTPDSHPREWWPTVGGGTNGFTLQGPLLDFAGLEPHMLFVRRVDHSWTFDNHHEAGIAQLFTGQKFFDEATHYANGPSLEQVLLKNTDIRGGTPVADIHLTAGDKGGADKRHVICYSGPGQPIPHEWDPAKAFTNIFNGVSFGGTTPAPTPTAMGPDLATQIKQASLDVDLGQLKKIQGFLGQEERERLDLHVDALNELENQIKLMGSPMTPPSTGAACEKVNTSGINSGDRNDVTIDKWAKVQADLIVNAFTCDRTRIADLGFGFSGSHHTGMMGLKAGDNDSWHDTVAHLSLNDKNRETGVTLTSGATTVKDAFIKFDRLWASQVAYLAKKLALIAEGDGSMLDNTLIYWGVESGTDHSHNPKDMQYLLIGGKNMGFQVGKFLQNSATQSAHKLHTSVLHGLGYTAATGFGIEPTCGPLDGVLG